MRKRQEKQQSERGSVGLLDRNLAAPGQGFGLELRHDLGVVGMRTSQKRQKGEHRVVGLLIWRHQARVSGSSSERHNLGALGQKNKAEKAGR